MARELMGLCVGGVSPSREDPCACGLGLGSARYLDATEPGARTGPLLQARPPGSPPASSFY